MTDKISHWLQGGALVAAIVALYIANKNAENASTTGAIQQAAPESLSTPGVLTAGTAGSAIAAAPITLGGNPVYLTYNYPPAPSNNVASTASNAPSNSTIPNPAAPPQPPACCSRCVSNADYTDGSLSMSYLGSGGFGGMVQQTRNLFSLPYKGGPLPSLPSTAY